MAGLEPRISRANIPSIPAGAGFRIIRDRIFILDHIPWFVRSLECENDQTCFTAATMSSYDFRLLWGSSYMTQFKAANSSHRLSKRVLETMGGEPCIPATFSEALHHPGEMETFKGTLNLGYRWLQVDRIQCLMAVPMSRLTALLSHVDTKQQAANETLGRSCNLLRRFHSTPTKSLRGDNENTNISNGILPALHHCFKVQGGKTIQGDWHSAGRRPSHKKIDNQIQVRQRFGKFAALHQRYLKECAIDADISRHASSSYRVELVAANAISFKLFPQELHWTHLCFLVGISRATASLVTALGLVNKLPSDWHLLRGLASSSIGIELVDNSQTHYSLGPFVGMCEVVSCADAFTFTSWDFGYLNHMSAAEATAQGDWAPFVVVGIRKTTLHPRYHRNHTIFPYNVAEAVDARVIVAAKVSIDRMRSAYIIAICMYSHPEKQHFTLDVILDVGYYGTPPATPRTVTAPTSSSATKPPTAVVQKKIKARLEWKNSQSSTNAETHVSPFATTPTNPPASKEHASSHAPSVKQVSNPWAEALNGQPTYGFNSGDNNREDEFYLSTPEDQGSQSTESSTICTVTACSSIQYRVDFGMFRDQAGGCQVLNYNIPNCSGYPAQRLKQISQRNDVIKAGLFPEGVLMSHLSSS
ncbi:uncharacterized protein MYCFIDRAFT_179402 [Pseudocercospora fijiensis CIRAD86]|uniref:Uncharacterized protein n=1 Tax=Pseudocercospora fijiensis (strain CIRAD86) TaxID=383855 RepID=M3A0L1_PSEFD|nr:uncharacterized protein MYCFIDRAFT_179402 [Pseudocercospora fijiensis CIRAD86]EME77946.1 hypothetical protein MYCFIDRAFT_179402 [Pseudocercospora fijiensis CIRAD86]